MRTKTFPRHARHLRAYAELESYLLDFARGIYPFLWVVGRPGAGKTESLRAALRGRDCLCRKGGQVTPLQLYTDLYRHRGEPVVLDDAEHLLANKVGAKLVSSLGEVSPAKLLCYASTARGLGDVPQSYYTTSPLCIISNTATAHEDIQSRAVTLYFDPTSLEVHRAVARWFWDQEIHDWFGGHLSRLPPLDARWYVLADRDKRALRDWRQIVMKAHALSRPHCLVQDLENDPAHPEREGKARRFVELMGNGEGASRATYFRIRRRLEDDGRLAVEPAAPIRLRLTRPPGTPSILELDSLDTPFAGRREEEPYPLDVPPRERFAQPIRGQAGTPAPPPRPALDDTLAWETQPQEEDERDE